MTSLCADVCLCRCGTQRKGQRTTRGALIDATLCFCDATSPERDARLATTKGFGRTKKKELSRNLLAVRSRISIYYTPTLYGKPFPVLRQLVSPLSSKKKGKKEKETLLLLLRITHILLLLLLLLRLSRGIVGFTQYYTARSLLFSTASPKAAAGELAELPCSIHSPFSFFFCCRNNIKRGEEVKVATEAHLLPVFL